MTAPCSMAQNAIWLAQLVKFSEAAQCSPYQNKCHSPFTTETLLNFKRASERCTVWISWGYVRLQTLQMKTPCTRDVVRVCGTAVSLKSRAGEGSSSNTYSSVNRPFSVVLLERASMSHMRYWRRDTANELGEILEIHSMNLNARDPRGDSTSRNYSVMQTHSQYGLTFEQLASTCKAT